MTDFSIVYDSFLSKITDDMYLELTELDTFRLLQEILISAIPSFEFPRVDLFDYECQDIVDEFISAKYLDSGNHLTRVSMLEDIEKGCF